MYIYIIQTKIYNLFDALLSSTVLLLDLSAAFYYFAFNTIQR